MGDYWSEDIEGEHPTPSMNKLSPYLLFKLLKKEKWCLTLLLEVELLGGFVIS